MTVPLTKPARRPTKASVNTHETVPMNLADSIRAIPDYPRPGIVFRDITTLLGDARAFRRAVDELVQPFAGLKIAKIAGIEARGFIFAAALAYKLEKGTLVLRKRDKLPGKRVGIDYALEYGTDRIAIHADAFTPGARVLLVDDLIATGGTALAAVRLLRKAGAEVTQAAFVIDLPELGGAAALRAEGIEVQALVPFAGH